MSRVPESNSNDKQWAIGQYIDGRRAILADAITERHFQAHPELNARYGQVGREKCRQDNSFHLSYLTEAITADSPLLFADYISWAKVMLAGRGVSAEDLFANLVVIRDVMQELLPEDMSAIAISYLDNGLAALPLMPQELPSFIGDNEPLSELAGFYLHALLRGERHTASRAILDAVAAGTDIKSIYLNVFQRTQYEIGRLWQINQVSVAQEHYCTAATQLIMSQLYPHIFSIAKNGLTIVASCVAEDLHEIGVRMISDFFEMAGWDTFYLGANCPTNSIIQTIIERKADMLAVSATITSHVHKVSSLIAAVRANPQTSNIKIIVGGYPFKLVPELWQRVGADATADNAVNAIELANRLMEH